MKKERLEELEYEACEQEKRDRMNNRSQNWAQLGALVGAFVLLNAVPSVLPSGNLRDAVSDTIFLYPFFYPLIAAGLAGYVGHSEGVLNQLKAYLLSVEVKAEHEGYEQYNLDSGRKGVGSHAIAFTCGVVFTDLLAFCVVVLHSLALSWYPLIGVSFAVTVIAMVMAYRWLGLGK